MWIGIHWRFLYIVKWQCPPNTRSQKLSGPSKPSLGSKMASWPTLPPTMIMRVGETFRFYNTWINHESFNKIFTRILEAPLCRLVDVSHPEKVENGQGCFKELVIQWKGSVGTMVFFTGNSIISYKAPWFYISDTHEVKLVYWTYWEGLEKATCEVAWRNMMCPRFEVV